MMNRNKPWTLSNFEIMDFMKHNPNFRGAFPKDKVPTLKPFECVVINLHNHDQKGSHWTCLYRDNEKYYYYDSYGGLPPKKVHNMIESNGVCNTFQAQPMDNKSVACGFYCIMVLDLLCKGFDFTDICYMFSYDMSHNDKYVFEYVMR